MPPWSWPSNTVAKIASMMSGYVKMKTTASRSRKNPCSSARVRSMPRRAGPGRAARGARSGRRSRSGLLGDDDGRVVGRAAAAGAPGRSGAGAGSLDTRAGRSARGRRPEARARHLEPGDLAVGVLPGERLDDRAGGVRALGAPGAAVEPPHDGTARLRAPEAVGRVERHDLPRPHDGRAVGQVGRLVEVVRREQDRRSVLAQRPDEPQNTRRAWGSNPVVGSSRNSSSGRPTIPSATSSRRRCPPESWRVACGPSPAARRRRSPRRGPAASGRTSRSAGRARRP